MSTSKYIGRICAGGLVLALALTLLLMGGRGAGEPAGRPGDGL